ncbi:GNAT family N-acetyltransferase [Cryptosporangium arvum]|uniref:Putative acetyltransferase n=1 Tax=Cryptosporangium arvum DSM 44712 TaxID=927661 RepID=A0A010YNC6_9ACTN|nr:GNAT family N-acetyltransferase [Cryptosporangium arvum]EXG81685.1 putative acetyltransferase [Cryptosporangium arvum DSM 44712]
MIRELAQISLSSGTVVLRRAEKPDLPTLVEFLAADQLGAHHENAEDLAPYEAAFAAIEADPAQLLVVAIVDGRIVGTFQLSVIPGLARRGSLRAQIEAVRVSDGYRNRGIGAAMMRWAIEEAGRRGCALVQLTSNKARLDAHRFYENLGFARSHDGFKLTV